MIFTSFVLGVALLTSKVLAAALPSNGEPSTVERSTLETLETRSDPGFFTSFSVAFGDNANQIPGNAIREMSGQSIDINKGFGGKYVWLIPNYSSSNINGAITIFYEVIPGGANTTPDLAKGAGGTFRYLKWQGQAYCPGDDFWFCPYVKEVKLWRNGSPKSSPPSGYDAMTTDINEARGGDYLYVVWKKS